MAATADSWQLEPMGIMHRPHFYTQHEIKAKTTIFVVSTI